MIKFQPFIAPFIPGYKACTCTLIFDKIGETEPVTDHGCDVIRLKTKWNDTEFSCLFFIDPNTSPTVVSAVPLLAGITGVISFPEMAEPMLHDFANISFEQVAPPQKKPQEEIVQELQELMDVMKEPNIDISQDVLKLMGEYANIENDKSSQAAFQCVKIISGIQSITMDEFKMMQGLPCGSPKLGAFVLEKLKQKLI